jgi:hypothetical protein
MESVDPFGGSLHAKDEFWKKLDGGSISQGPGPRREEYDGYEIIGFVVSKLKLDGSTADYGGGTFTDAIKERKFVGALGVKTFKTMKDAEKAEGLP